MSPTFTVCCAGRTPSSPRHSVWSVMIGGKPRALDQILDLHFAVLALGAALNDGNGRAAPVGILQLLAKVLRVALIHFAAG